MQPGVLIMLACSFLSQGRCALKAVLTHSFYTASSVLTWFVYECMIASVEKVQCNVRLSCICMRPFVHIPHVRHT